MGEGFAPQRKSCMQVQPLSGQEAQALFQLYLKTDPSSLDLINVERLLKVLDYIPLAITQAAASIRRNKWTVEGYLAALEANEQIRADYLPEELQDHRRPQGYPNSIFLTWKMSFDQILKHESSTAKLLSLMAMLHPHRIPENLIKHVLTKDIDFRVAIGTLCGYALITQDVRENTYSIHPLVQSSVQYWLEQNREKPMYAGQALKLLAEHFPTGEFKNREICESLLVHDQAVLGYEPISDEGFLDREFLLYNVAWFNRCQGRYKSAY